MTYKESLSALSDPTRRHVFEVLKGRPQSVSEIATLVPVSRPAVSQHLKILSDAGLVQVTAKGNRRIYAHRPEGLAALRSYLEQFWTDVLDGFAVEVEKLEGSDHDGSH